jgi:Zn-finger in ubiquitin-hydrolases and other protein
MHVKDIRSVNPSAAGCEECLKIGDDWVHLRLCLHCGHVGCCDSSKNKHATKHFRATKHPIVKSIEPGEDWGSSPHRVRETAGTEHKKHKRHKTEGRTLTFALFVFRSCLFPPTAKSAVKLNHGGELLLSQAGQGQLALKEVSLGIKNLEIALDTAAIAHFR